MLLSIWISSELPFGEDEQHAFLVHAQAGAGGGGGADVGSGLIFHGSVGYGYRISERLDLTLEYGRLEASKGTFEAESFLAGLSWNLNQVFFR